MAQSVLPNSINYADQLPALIPGVQNFTQRIQPNNGSIFYQSQKIQIDIPSRGFLDPSSIYISFKMNVGATGGAFNGKYMLGCPLYTPFQAVDTMINSQIVDNVPDYNVVAHVWTNSHLGVNEKYGNQYGFGYLDPTNGTVSLDELDGRLIADTADGATNSHFVSGPLVCTKLTGCEKFIPAFATGGIRLIFTLDTLANMFSTTTNLSTTTTNISNFELSYDLVDFGPEVEQMVMSQPNIMIKSNGYNNSSVPSGTSTGTSTFVFNQRLASIRSAIVAPSGTAVTAKLLNGKFDAVDVTTGGYYSLVVGGLQYPQAGPISFANNKATALSELRKATGNLYNWEKSMSINATEFGYTEDQTTTCIQPGKVYVGFDLNKINSGGKNMLNGISSQNSPINVVLNIATAPANSKNIYLILNYDCIFMIDPRTKMISMNQ